MLTDRPRQWYPAVCQYSYLRPSREDVVEPLLLNQACLARMPTDRPGQWYAAACQYSCLRPSREDALEPLLLSQACFARMPTDDPANGMQQPAHALVLSPSQEDALEPLPLNQACLARMLTDRPDQWYAAACPCSCLKTITGRRFRTATAEPVLPRSYADRSRLMACSSLLILLP